MAYPLTPEFPDRFLYLSMTAKIRVVRFLQITHIGGMKAREPPIGRKPGATGGAHGGCHGRWFGCNFASFCLIRARARRPRRWSLWGMKAIYFNQIGEPADVLRTGDFPIPVPGPGEVLVRVLRRTVNPSDISFIKGKYRFQPQLPQIAGFEGAGVVESGALPAGTLVSFFGRPAWAEYAVVPVDGLFVLPTGFPLDKAAQFALNPFTAWGLLERAAVPAGGWLGLSAGNSAVSGIVAQLAARRGIRTIAAVRQAAPESGAAPGNTTSPIFIPAEGSAARIMDLPAGAGLTAVLDSVGGPIGTELLNCLAPNGRFIAYGAASPESLAVPNGALVYKFVTLSGFGIRAYMGSKSEAERAQITAALIAATGAEDFSMPVAATYPLEEFRAALRAKGK